MSSSSETSTIKRVLLGTALVGVTVAGASLAYYIYQQQQQVTSKSASRVPRAAAATSTSSSTPSIIAISSSSSRLTSPLLDDAHLVLYTSCHPAVLALLRDDVISPASMNDANVAGVLSISHECAIDTECDKDKAERAIRALNTEIERITNALQLEIQSTSTSSPSPTSFTLICQLLDLLHNRCCHYLDMKSYESALLDARICVAMTGSKWIRALQLAGFAELYLKRPYDASVWYKQAFELEQHPSPASSTTSSLGSLSSVISTTSTSTRPPSRVSSSFLPVPTSQRDTAVSDDEWDETETDVTSDAGSSSHVPIDIGNSVLQQSQSITPRIPRHPYNLIPARAMLDALQNQLVSSAMTGPLRSYASAANILTEMIDRNVADRAELKALLLKRAECYMHTKDLVSALRDAVSASHVSPSTTDPSSHVLSGRILLMLGRAEEAYHELEKAVTMKPGDVEIGELKEIAREQAGIQHRL